MSQSYDDFIRANLGYDDTRIPVVEEPIDEPGYSEIPVPFEDDYTPEQEG